MVGSKSDARSAAAWALAGRQHGVLTRADLMTIGFSRHAIQHRVMTGRLHPVGRGVYAVGWPQLTDERRWMSAVLACGRGAALSHRSAAALWRIWQERDEIVEISVARPCELRRPGMRIRGRPTLIRQEIVTERGIPVTSPALTLLDLATEFGCRALERAVNDADKHDLVSPDQLRQDLGRFRGRPGVRRLRAVLDLHIFQLSDSNLEILFREIAEGAGLPPPLMGASVNGFEVDFFWPDLGLIVETDGLRYHRTPAAQARDRLRDQTHTAAGLTPLRFTHRQVAHESPHVLAVLKDTIERLRPVSASEV